MNRDLEERLRDLNEDRPFSGVDSLIERLRKGQWQTQELPDLLYAAADALEASQKEILAQHAIILMRDGEIMRLERERDEARARANVRD